MTANLGAQLRAIAVASGLALLAGSALAQTAPPAGAPGGAPRGAPSDSMNAAPQQPPRPTPDPLASEDVSKITGAAVYGGDNKKVGSVSTVLMQPQSKTIDRFVIGQGGVLGVGSHYVALPISNFRWDSQAGAFRIAKTADDVKAMPEWNEQVSEVPAANDSGNKDTGTMRPSGGLETAPPVTAPIPPSSPAPSDGRI